MVRMLDAALKKVAGNIYGEFRRTAKVPFLLVLLNFFYKKGSTDYAEPF